MKNFLGKKYVQIGITAFCVIAASMLFLFLVFFHSGNSNCPGIVIRFIPSLLQLYMQQQYHMFYGRLSVLWSAVWFIGSVRKKTGIQLIKYAMRFG